MGVLSRNFCLSFVLSAHVLRESWGLLPQEPSGPRGLSDLVCLVPLLSICTVGFLQLQRASHPYSLINSLLLRGKPEAVRMSLARIPGAYYLEEVAHSQTLPTRALNPFRAVSPPQQVWPRRPPGTCCPLSYTRPFRALRGWIIQPLNHTSHAASSTSCILIGMQVERRHADSCQSFD